jgi:hydroxymethylglutaryl-CoA lyase
VKAVAEAVTKLADEGIGIISLSDTIGEAKVGDIEDMFSSLIPMFPGIDFGAHFHTRPDNWEKNIAAAHKGGCRRFDGALKGFGGCPMAKDDLTGNLPTENLVSWLSDRHEPLRINQTQLEHCLQLAMSIFPPISA